MRGLRTTHVALFFVSAIASCSFLSAQCKAVHAEIIDASSPEGCTSTFNFCAAGTVEGNRGLNGTTYFVLDGVAEGPTTAPGFTATTGTLVYTTREGTLTVRETGIAKFSGHPSNGYGAALEEVVSGTGRFAGATGTLHVRQQDINSQFFSKISGELCLAEDRGHHNSHIEIFDENQF
jgi:hypothetical protein